MTQAILRTDRLTLAPLSDAHLDGEIELDGDAGVMRFLDSGAHPPDVVAADHRERVAAAGLVPGFGYWAAERDGRFTALMSLMPPHRSDQTGSEIGWRVLARCWRQGIATEAAWALIEHGFGELGAQRIFAETMFVNTASRATMAKLGLRHVRTFHKHFDDPLPGTEKGEVEYALTRDDWLTGRTG